VPLAQVVASPDQLRELGAGFVLCEGLSERVEDVRVSRNEIRVYAGKDAPAGLPEQRKLDYELRASGCMA